MMDPEDPSTFDDGTYEELNPRNKERFEEEFQDNLDEFEEDDIEADLRRDYNEQKEHLELIKATCAAFHPKDGALRSESGFKLLGTNPLIDIEDTPADVISVKPEYNGIYITIICCEIGGENRGAWIENVNSAHRFFSSPESQQYINDRLDIDEEELDIGYVTLVRDDDTTDLDFSVLNNNCSADKYATWECDTGDKWLRHVNGSLVHPSLRDAFQDQIDYSKRETPLEYVIKSHPIFPLGEIIYRIVKENTEFGAEEVDEFNRQKFLEQYTDRLRIFSGEENPDSFIRAESERILHHGLAADILTDDVADLNTSKDYRVIYTGPRGPQHAKKAVKRRYFENMPTYEKGRKTFELTKDEFERDSDLSDF